MIHNVKRKLVTVSLALPGLIALAECLLTTGNTTVAGGGFSANYFYHTDGGETYAQYSDPNVRRTLYAYDIGLRCDNTTDVRSSYFIETTGTSMGSVWQTDGYRWGSSGLEDDSTHKAKGLVN
jgi:hypothetical protein